MKRLALLVLVPFLLAAKPDPGYDIPIAGLTTLADGTRMGYCVTFYEGTDFSTVRVPFHQIRPNSRTFAEDFRVSTQNALLAVSDGNPRLGSMIRSLHWQNGKLTSATIEGQKMACECSTQIWDGDPRTGGKFKGCSGGCGACLRCAVITPQIE